MLYEKTVTLKTGESCLIRSCASADAEAVLKEFLLVHGETENLLTYPEETSFTVEGEADFLQKRLEAENAVLLGAFIDGVLVGTAGIEPVGGVLKLRHRAEFGVSIEKAFWGRGIGAALTEAAIDCAEKAGYDQLELEVIGTNASAVALYEKCGFAEYGRNPLGFLTKSGSYQPLVLMRRELLLK